MLQNNNYYDEITTELPADTLRIYGARMQNGSCSRSYSPMQPWSGWMSCQSQFSTACRVHFELIECQDAFSVNSASCSCSAAFVD